MTSPAVTIGPDDTVEHAAQLMYDRKVKRLAVVDPAGRPIGIISRTDVLAVFDRADAEIRAEIMSQVITGCSEPSWYSVIVKDGVVTLEGTPETVAIGRNLVRRARHVQGVVAVRDVRPRAGLGYARRSPLTPVAARDERHRRWSAKPGPSSRRPLAFGSAASPATRVA